MKTHYIIEDAEELLRFANPNRVSGDTRPFINFNDGAILVISSDRRRVWLDGIPEFALSQSITFDDLLVEMAEDCHLKFKIGE